MNKKFMSFVLAMVLSVGLGSSLYASYSDYATNFNKQYSTKIGEKSVKVKVGKPSDLLGGNLTAVFGYYAGSLISYQGAGGQFQLYDSYGARFSVDNKGGAWNVNSVNLRSSDLAQMEGKTAKEFLMSMGLSETSLQIAKLKETEDADGNKAYDLVDENGQAIKQVTSLDSYMKNGSFDSKSFLKDCGYSEEEIKALMKNGAPKIQRADDDGDGEKDDGITSVVFKRDTYDDEGNPTTEDVKLGTTKLNNAFMSKVAKTDISDSWWSTLKNTLKRGVNFSATVQVGSGITGPQLIVSENGKTMASFITDTTDPSGIRQTALYRYDDNGFLLGIQEATFELDETSNGVAEGKWEFNYTKTSYDSHGVRTDTKYQFFNWSNTPEETLAAAGKLPNASPNLKIDEKTPVAITSITTYSANNSALSSIDYTTGETTFYANNKPSYTVNELGITTQLYEYSANGVIQSFFKVDNTDSMDGTGQKVGTMTIYDQWGRQLFSATGGIDEFKSQTFKDSLVAEYNAGLASNKFNVAQFEKGEVEKEVLDEEGNVVYEDKDKTKPKTEKVEGYVAKSGTGTRISNICIYADQILDTSNQNIMTNGFIDMWKVQNFLNTTGNMNNIISNNLSGFGYNATDLLNMLRFANGTNTALAQTSITMSSWDADELPAGADMSNVDEKSETINVGTTVEHNTVNKNKTVSKSMGTHTWHQVLEDGSSSSSETKHTGNKKDLGIGRTTYNGISYNNTILLGGAQAYSTTHNVISEKIDVYREMDIDQETTTITNNYILETDPAVQGTLVTTEGMSEEEIVALAAKMGINVDDPKALAKFKEEAANGYFTDSNGDIYAMVKDFQINLMDGNGFTQKQDEILLVKLNGTNGVDENGNPKKMTTEELNAVKAKITEALNATGDDKGRIMFMGNASYQEGTKNVAVTIDISFGDGVATGADIKAAAEEIDKLSKQVAEAKAKYESGDSDMSKEEFDKIVKDAGWVGTNTIANLEKFGANGANGFSWDNDKTAEENLRAAWELLLNF